MSSSNVRLEKFLIPLEEIRSATKDFDKETLIGYASSHNNVYKGQFTERLQNCTAAVKRFDSRHYGQKEGYLNELNFISKFDHENIIPFIGYCNEGGEMIIVSEYAINGTLYDHLEDPNKMLSMTWPQRLKICLGIAKAIIYLHSDLSEDYVVIHRNIKTRAILLDENLEAKICNFVYSKEVGRNQQHVYEKVVTVGNYDDPIYGESGILKKEADVYSFGVVMFELLCGTAAYHRKKIGDGEPQLLIKLVRRYYNIDGLEKLIDSQIRDQADRRSLDTFKETAYRCISYNLNDRPSMETIVKRITEALDIHNHAAAATITIRSHPHQNLEHLLIPREEISLAARNFGPENQIGHGKGVIFYKGQLSGRWENRTVFFKRNLKEYKKRVEMRRNELQLMSASSHHERIIRLIGYCDERGEMILVYDYAVNGSLELHLEAESKRRCLTWVQRLKICIGAAIGLEHLQASHGDDKILVHRNFRSSKILLDDNMEPLICASGFSIVVDRNKEQVYDFNNGEMFYLDPIYKASGILKAQTDVYSLGVVLFEMLSGMLPWHERSNGNDEPQRLMNLVRRCLYDDGVVKLIDPLIKDQIDIRSFLIFKEIASKCISFNLKDRPSWNRIIKRLEEALRIHQVNLFT